VSGLLVLGVFLGLTARGDQPIYTDSLQNNWVDWSWATVSFANSSPTHSGSASIGVSCTNYQALFLHHNAFDSTAYSNLTFWINGGSSGGQVLLVQATANSTPSGAGFTMPALSANTWQLTSANAISRLADIHFTGGVFTNTVPAQSITLFVLPFGTPPPAPTLQSGSPSATNTFDLWLQGTTGQRYVLLSSTNLADWTPIQTNTLASSSWHLVLPTGGLRNFYRGQWAP
jgi:hypothetical protein